MFLFDGTLVRDVLRDVLRYLRVYQKCLSIFFILCRYIDKVYRVFFFQNVLSPEGRCVAYPVGVQLFLLMFYFGLGNAL